MYRLYNSLLILLMSVWATAGASQPSPIEDFELTADNGKSWRWHQVHGKVALVTFGYTACPDVCPLTLSVVAQVLQKLNTASEKVQPIFISVDSMRDSPEVLHQYVNYFDHRIVGLTGTTEEIATAAQRFHVSFNTSSQDSDSFYTVDHSTDLFVVNSEGVIIAIVPFGFPVDHIVRLVNAEWTRKSSTP